MTRVLAVRKETGKQRWGFYLVNRGARVESLRLVQVGYEYGDSGSTIGATRELGAIDTDAFVEIWRDDDDASELKMWLELEAVVTGETIALTFELPRLYRTDLTEVLPLVGGTGALFPPAETTPQVRGGADAVADAAAALANSGAAGVEAVLQLIRVSPNGALVESLRRAVAEHGVELPDAASPILSGLLPWSDVPCERWDAGIVPGAIDLLTAMGSRARVAVPKLQAMQGQGVFDELIDRALANILASTPTPRASALPDLGVVRARIRRTMDDLNEMLEEPYDPRDTPPLAAQEAATAVVHEIFALDRGDAASVESLAAKVATLRARTRGGGNRELLAMCDSILSTRH